MAINPVTGKRGPGRPIGGSLPRVPPALKAQQTGGEVRTLASMLDANFDQRAPGGEASAPPPYETSAEDLRLPSEIPEAPYEPQEGAPGMRASLHEVSASALAAGYGGPSAEEPAEPVPAEPTFRRNPLHKRVPFGVREQRMAWPPIPGFHLHWFNDDPGRIRRAEAAGYTSVEAHGRPVMQIVGTDRAGKPLAAFLMKIPEAYFTEDMLAIEHEQQQILGAIKRGRFQAGENAYVPKQGINVRDSVERR